MHSPPSKSLVLLILSPGETLLYSLVQECFSTMNATMAARDPDKCDSIQALYFSLHTLEWASFQNPLNAEVTNNQMSCSNKMSESNGGIISFICNQFLQSPANNLIIWLWCVEAETLKVEWNQLSRSGGWNLCSKACSNTRFLGTFFNHYLFILILFFFYFTQHSFNIHRYSEQLVS